MRYALATRSAGKLRELREILAPFAGVEVLSLADLDVPYDPEEEGIEVFHTFRENALAKARYFARRTGLPTLADDSGLRVAALDGAPGVHSKRFASGDGLSGAALDDANNRLLLEKLDGVPAEQRDAWYVCAAACVLAHGREIVTVGTTRGRIAAHPRGTGGFGYDPLFLIPELGRTFGEIPAVEKHGRSHRARAFRALATLLPASGAP